MKHISPNLNASIKKSLMNDEFNRSFERLNNLKMEMEESQQSFQARINKMEQEMKSFLP